MKLSICKTCAIHVNLLIHFYESSIGIPRDEGQPCALCGSVAYLREVDVPQKIMEQICSPAQERGKMECEYGCENWASNGMLPLLSHHSKCPNYNPTSELIKIVTDLLKGIESWASGEDGIPDECFDAYKRAKVAMGQFDVITGETKRAPGDTKEGREKQQTTAAACPVV